MNVSTELDNLSCDLLESALDALAAGMTISVLVSTESQEGRETQIFDDDTLIACIEGAHEYIANAAKTAPAAQKPLRYAIVYPATVEVEPHEFADALILEFGEKGMEVAYSAYILVDGIGQQDEFSWTDPSPAGEVDLLV